MRTLPKQMRQQMACGYEVAAPPGIEAQAWSGLGYKGPAPATCPGYTTTLPEVIEVARAWRWWDKGELARFVRGDEVSDDLILGIDVFEGAVRELERWLLTPADRGGGRA
jgi:hypothetical protein